MMVDRRCSAAAAALTLVLAFAACDSPVAPPFDESAQFARNADGTLSKPFKALLETRGLGIAPDAACGAPPRFLNRQVGAGNATHTGRFTVYFQFCVDLTDLLDDGVLTAGESLPYDNVLAVLTAANGDELHVGGTGVVLPSDQPGFDFEFHDSFSFTGGTGRFAGAAGGGATDSFVDQAADLTNHRWQATLILPH